MNFVINDLVFFSVIGIIAVFLLKLYNVLTACSLYDRAMSVIALAMGLMFYLFIEVGLFLNLTLEFNFFMWFSRVFILIIFVLWVVEILVYAAVSISNDLGLSRMMKKRSEKY